MSQPRLIHITSTDELRAAASLWDDLWWRSGVTTPTARAELLAQWLEQFAPQANFHALVVEDEGNWVAALPLMRATVRHVLSAGTMCGSTWMVGGGLLLDTPARADAALDILVRAARDLPWQVLWFAAAAINAPSWKAFERAVTRAGIANHVDEEYQVGLMEIGRDWELCQKRWSGKLRYNMGRGARKLSKGGVQFKRYSQPEPEELEALLRRGFDVEHRSWKGQARSSILARGQFGFVLRQAEQLARWGQLELAFLEAGARTIAFCYGFNAKGVYHVCKMAYDPESEYATFSPGQLLLYNILERLHRDQDCRALDFFGRLTEAMSKWRPATYAIGRVVVAPRRLLGRVAVHTYKHWWPQIRRFRGSLELLSPKTGG